MTNPLTKSFRVWFRQPRNWKIVSIRSLFSRFFENLTIGYQNIYITLLGASAFHLGLVNAFANVSGGLISAPLGWLQDKFSLKKIFLVGVTLSLVVAAIFGLATTWTMIIPAMLIYSVSMSVGACLTICDVSVRDADRSTCKGLCDGFFQIPSLFAPVLAAFLITYFGGMTTQGIRPLYWIQFTGGLILFLIVLISLTEIKRPPIQKSQGFLSDYKEVFQNGTGLKRWTAFLLVNMFSFSMLAPFIPLLYAFEVKGASSYILGGMTTAGILTLVVFSPFFGPLADKIGRKKVAFLLEPFYILAFVVLVYASSPVFLLIAAMLNGIRQLVSFISFSPLQVEMVPIEYRGRWRGFLGLLTGLGSIPAPILGGWLWQTFGPSSVIVVAIIIDITLRMPLLSIISEKPREVIV